MRTSFYYSLNENEKIMNIIEKVFNATSPETAVSMEQIIDKGIALGVTYSYPRGRADGHPWWPRTSLMAGVGSEAAVMENEEKHLFRQKMSKNGSRVKMYYWVDRTKDHEVITRSSKATKADTKTELLNHIKTHSSPVPVGKDLTIEEKFGYYNNAYPGCYTMTKNIKTGEKKIILNSWIERNPDKFMELYGGMTI